MHFRVFGRTRMIDPVSYGQSNVNEFMRQNSLGGLKPTRNHMGFPRKKTRQSKATTLAAALLVMAVTGILTFGVWSLLSRAVENSIYDSAEATALEWTDYFKNNLPNIELLVETGKANEDQSQFIDIVGNLGQVFRFKLFRPDGTIALVSDEYRFVVKEGNSLSGVNAKALSVFETGLSLLYLNRGTPQDGRPDTYVEAYVCLLYTSDAADD